MKDFSLADVRLFIKAVELGGLTLAADVLDVPKASASRQLQRLEASVGHVLLHRGAARFALTKEGRQFFETAVDMLRAVDRAMSSLYADERALTGRLRIAAPTCVGRQLLAAHLPDFMAAHPQLQLSLELGNGRVDLFRDEADVALRLGREGCEELVARRLATVPMLLCASPAYLARSNAIVTLSDLAGHAFLTDGAHRRVGEMTLPTAGHPRNVSAATVLHCNDPELRLALARADRGIALVPAALAATAMETGELVAVLPSVPLADEEINLVFLPGRRNSRKIRLFVEYLLDATQAGRPADVGNGGESNSNCLRIFKN